MAMENVDSPDLIQMCPMWVRWLKEDPLRALLGKCHNSRQLRLPLQQLLC